MPEQLPDPVLVAIAGGTMLLSIATCLCLLAVRSRGSLLQFQPRSPVPWNAAGCVLAVVMVWLTVWSVLSSYSMPEPKGEGEATNHATQLITGMVPEVLLVGGVLTFIAIYFNANRRDLGLPASSQQFAHDFAIGSIAGLAALAPVLLIQALLLYWLGMPEMKSGHPLIKMLAEGKPDLTVMLLGSLFAVIVAPICEEITFRLLLQGWLERWEGEEMGYGEAPPTQSAVGEETQAPDALAISIDEAQLANDEHAEPLDSSIKVGRQSIETPPSRGFAGFPFSWIPIAISSLLFGLAHLGYGPEPVPLFFLALVLGHLYYRTHRIVPSIVAHALFNLFAMVQLWWMAWHSATRSYTPRQQSCNHSNARHRHSRLAARTLAAPRHSRPTCGETWRCRECRPQILRPIADR